MYTYFRLAAHVKGHACILYVEGAREYISHKVFVFQLQSDNAGVKEEPH